MKRIILVMALFLFVQTVAVSETEVIAEFEISIEHVAGIKAGTDQNGDIICLGEDDYCYSIITITPVESNTESLADYTDFDTSYFVPGDNMGHIGLQGISTTPINYNGENGVEVDFILKPGAIPITSIQDVYSYYEGLGLTII